MLCLTLLTIVPTSFPWRPLFLPTLSLLPLGMAPVGWDEEETLEQGSSLLPLILQYRNFHYRYSRCSIYLFVTRTVPKLILLHKTSSSLFLPSGHKETFVFAYYPTRFHGFRSLGLFIVFS